MSGCGSMCITPGRLCRWRWWRRSLKTKARKLPLIFLTNQQLNMVPMLQTLQLQLACLMS
ncbi:hypothetical protein LA22_17110 [Xanthomonas oryzae pv. oryzae]|nr:hypothetical protein LA20_16775 [Xanthomonas oryzae pv. oryzae]PNR72364.1 hypothetical protein LA21_17365 [Xanthomonas oryzae pv. oryzae]PNR73305.1 hypothetical protein LA22_17110 [Xanthomonas oryzae pv. oryzae]RBK11986.1 hypothetical protein BRN96_17515 [Xanthomonas oryzae pv. oryzae]